ncbi:serine/threonine-protein phosphatase 4 regulatory subunit 4 [Octopus bimaculoides]|uniref:serine/threonine-protein phosphatase 4 regulatory subunit 4 n=1 Tax=Octopus bimaculoides TaxID=37653 RepID=UPI00071DE9C4|nr:serine/threonine-protein phosphatase 4 regulatory subunit 4 [Octopus bimaculoides]|eukprot:XP_014772993.1 PREDICTED: serine/threonine-protein phosphatase 4 regulatory subunit 4-like [Octopus bimaculoides]
MDKFEEDVYPSSSTNLEQFLNDPLLLEPANPNLPVTSSTTIANFSTLYNDADLNGSAAHTESDLDALECARNESQQLSVVNNLPDLLKSGSTECLEKVVPRIQEVLNYAQADIQRAASTAFLQILQKEQVAVQNYAQTFLQTILTSIDNKNPDISSAWLGTLLDVIDLLPKTVIQKEILTAAVAKGQLSQSVQARLSCCQILGKIATKFDPFVIKKEILPIVQSLCQDVDYEVRGCMCKQLNPVARGLGLEATKSAILPELVELTNDEEVYVRMMGLETVVNILSLLDDDTCSNTIIPLVIRFYEQCLYSKDHTLPIIAKHIGRLCHGLSANLNEKQKDWFLDCYKKLCEVGYSDKNSNSSEYGAISLFVGAKDFESELLETFSMMCKDSLPAVRKNIAHGFHEVVKLLDFQSGIVLKNLADLLRDNNLEVLSGVTSHLAEIFEVLGKHKHSENQVAEIIPAIMAAESVIFSSYSWRLQEEFVLTLSSLPKWFNSETIYVKIMPVIYTKLKKARALPVKLAVARTFLTLLRTLKKAEYREQLINKLTEELSVGNCYFRSLFLDVCSISLDIYSKSFFKEKLFDNALSLYCDPVPNIRLKLCRFIPCMKQTLNLPEDDARLSDLCNVVSKILRSDKDPDVLSFAKQALWDLEQIVVPVHLLGSKTQEKLQTAEDLIDLHREAEEISLLNDEKNEEKSKVKKDVPFSKIPSPRKVSAQKSTSEKRASPTPLKECKKSLSNCSSSLTPVSSPKVKTKGSSIPNCRLVKSRSTSSICSASQIPKRDSKLVDSTGKRDTKIPVIGTSSLPTPKDGKSAETRLCNNTRIPRVSTPVRPPSPTTVSHIPTSAGVQKQAKSGIKPTSSNNIRKNNSTTTTTTTTTTAASTATTNSTTTTATATITTTTTTDNSSDHGLVNRTGYLSKSLERPKSSVTK